MHANKEEYLARIYTVGLKQGTYKGMQYLCALKCGIPSHPEVQLMTYPQNIVYIWPHYIESYNSSEGFQDPQVCHSQ